MSPAAEMLDAALESLEYVQGNPTLIYLGRHWPCTAAALTRGMDLGLGAPINRLTRQVTVRKSALPTRTADQMENGTVDSESITADENLMPPHPGKLVSFESRQYEVDSVEETETCWRLNLVSPDS